MKEQLQHPLLVVEDSDEDFEALSRILRRDCQIELAITRCADGDDALDFIYRRGQFDMLKEADLPGLILLDLNLPGTDGREVLAQIKQDKQLKKIPIVVFTTSSNPKDIHTCYQSGVNSFMIKPTNIRQLKASIQTLVNYWFQTVELPVNA
ncbi:MAG: response regulator [Leptolyngbyaceae cyanobacterium]